VILDGVGNVYAAGEFKVSVSIGTNTFTNSGEKDGFVAKFNSAGDFQWAQQMSGASDAAVLGVSVDGSGNLYVTGGFGNVAGDTISFAPSIILTTIGGGLGDSGVGDAFLARYDGLTRTPQWAVRAGGGNGDAYTGVATDSKGNVYVGGGTGGTGLLDGFNGFNAIVSKYDTNGTLQWTQSSLGPDGALVFGGPVVDADGNSYVAGWFHTPEHLIRAGVIYNWRDGVKVAFLGTFVDDHFATDDEDATRAIPSYTVWDLTAGVKVYKNYLSVMAGMNNIFDEQYYARIRGDGIDPAYGRNYYAGLSLTF
jgi:hypothetical protein